MLRCMLAVAASTTFALAQTADAVLVPVADTTLYEDAAGAIANGAGESVFVGVNAFGQKRRAIVRFDVAAALPPRARIVAVELRMQVAQGSTATPMPVTLHRVTAGWNEGSANATFGREGQ